MLARYQIVRGKRSPDQPLPAGRRIDTRKHTRHFLRPEAAAVALLLASNDEASYARFAQTYEATLAERFAAQRASFDALADQARSGDVYLGCSCPSRANPDVQRCHTVLALRFMQTHYRGLKVIFP
jgi:hypothetical protein